MNISTTPRPDKRRKTKLAKVMRSVAFDMIRATLIKRSDLRPLRLMTAAEKHTLIGKIITKKLAMIKHEAIRRIDAAKLLRHHIEI